jgi:hypothetical protein
MHVNTAPAEHSMYEKHSRQILSIALGDAAALRGGGSACLKDALPCT